MHIPRAPGNFGEDTSVGTRQASRTKAGSLHTDPSPGEGCSELSAAFTRLHPRLLDRLAEMGFSGTLVLMEELRREAESCGLRGSKPEGRGVLRTPERPGKKGEPIIHLRSVMTSPFVADCQHLLLLLSLRQLLFLAPHLLGNSLRINLSSKIIGPT